MLFSVSPVAALTYVMVLPSPTSILYSPLTLHPLSLCSLHLITFMHLLSCLFLALIRSFIIPLYTFYYLFLYVDLIISFSLDVCAPFSASLFFLCHPIASLCPTSLVVISAPSLFALFFKGFCDLLSALVMLFILLSLNISITTLCLIRPVLFSQRSAVLFTNILFVTIFYPF